MNRPRRALLLLTIFCCHAAAYWVLPLANLAHAHAQAAAKISEHEGLAVFHFSKKDFQQSRVGQHEFSHNGMMHDIASWHESPGDSVRVVARPDAHEQRLLVGLQRFFRPDAAHLPGGNGSLSKLLAQFLGQNFLAPEPLARLAAPDFRPAKTAFFHREMPLGRLPETFVPPPKI